MMVFKKIGQSLTALALIAFSRIEEKKRKIRIKDRMKRSEEKYGW
jgi:hypothetical protein